MMGDMGWIKNCVTGKDGLTHDLARIVMAINAIMLVLVFVLAIGFYLYGWIVGKSFDMQSFFTAVLTYVGGVGTLLTTGAAAIFFKKSTEPDGSSQEETRIQTGSVGDDKR